MPTIIIKGVEVRGRKRRKEFDDFKRTKRLTIKATLILSSLVFIIFGINLNESANKKEDVKIEILNKSYNGEDDTYTIKFLVNEGDLNKTVKEAEVGSGFYNRVKEGIVQNYSIPKYQIYSDELKKLRSSFILFSVGVLCVIGFIFIWVIENLYR